MSFIQISPYEITDNPFHAIGEEWMLLTAGDVEKCNAMTASWGQMGIVWNKPSVTLFVRPQRYTYEFMEKSSHFSLSFFNPGTHRDALNMLGVKSGRDTNKMEECGLTPILLDGVPTFAESSLVYICRKLYQQDIDPTGFIDTTLDSQNYPKKDYHHMIIGEIEKVYKAK